MSRRRTRGLVGVGAALLLVAAGCGREEAGLDAPGDDGSPPAAGGAGGEAGDGGASGGGGGNAGSGGEPVRGEIIGSCDPDSVTPTCAESNTGVMELFRCDRRENDGELRRIQCGPREFCLTGHADCIVFIQMCQLPSCEVGSTICAKSAPGLMTCQEYWSEEGAAQCTDFWLTERCAAGETCIRGECVPDCTMDLCECNGGLLPVCGANGHTYWNACQRDCAGVAAGSDCRFDELTKVWESDSGLYGLGALPGGRALVSYRPTTREESQAKLNRGCVVKFDAGPDGHLESREEVCALVGLGEDTASLGAVDDSVVIYGYYLDPRLQVVNLPVRGGAPSFGASASFSSAATSLACSATLEGDRVLLFVPGRLLAFEPGDELSVRALGTFSEYTDEPDPGQTSAWGSWQGEPGLLFAGTADRQFSVRRFDIADSFERTLLYRGYAAGSIIDLAFWSDSGFDGLSVASGLMLDDGYVMFLEDFVWDNGCLVRRQYLEFLTTELAARLGAGDLEADGRQELAFSDGTQTFVFGRGPQGWLVLRAVVPADRLTLIDPVLLDLDGDGRDELVPILMWPPEARDPPISAAYRLSTGVP